MPQIAQLAETLSSQIFWMLLTFGFVFFVIGLGMVPKVQSTVDARGKKIADDLATAKAASERADAIEADYRVRTNESRAQAQKLIVQAKDQAAKASEQRLREADAKIGETIAAAEARIAAASSNAMAEIESVVADVAQQMVAKISGAQPEADTARNAVKAALAHG